MDKRTKKCAFAADYMAIVLPFFVVINGDKNNDAKAATFFQFYINM